MTTAHTFLTDEGAYVHDHIEAEWDDGDAESGPGCGGHPAFDMYSGDSHDIVLNEKGIMLDLQPRDFDFEAYCQEHMDDGAPQ